MITSIYKICLKCVKNKFNKKIKYYAWYRGQFDSNDKPNNNYPAILIEVNNGEAQILSSGLIHYDAQVHVHIGIQVVNTLEDGNIKIDNSLELLELIDDVRDNFSKISGLSTYYSGETSEHVNIGQFSEARPVYNIPNDSIFHSVVTFNVPIDTMPKELEYSLADLIYLGLSGQTNLEIN